MRNYDAIIAIGGILMFVIGWVAASINHNHRIKELKDLIEEIKSASNDIYLEGWQAGWDALATNPTAMDRELTRMRNMRSVPRPD